MAAEAAANPWRRTTLIAGAVVALNAFDCLFTLAILQLRLCEELNPLMRELYQASPFAFAAVKLALVNAGVGVLVRLEANVAARAALAMAGITYLGLAAYELAYLASRLPWVCS